jgi:hypothetical protein
MADALTAGISIPEGPSLDKQLAIALRALAAVARGQLGAAEDALAALEVETRLVSSAVIPRPQVGMSLLRLVSWR